MKSRAASTPIANSVFTLLIAVILIAAFACASDETLPALESRAQEINKTVMCPVCPGESIDQSQHPRAKAMRIVVDEKLQEGLNNDEIRQFFVDRYGPSVLLEPPRDGLNWLVWIVPPFGILAAALALYVVLRRAVLSPNQPAGITDEVDVLTEAERGRYFKRIEAALASDPQGERPPPTDAEKSDRGEAVAG